MKKMLPTPLGFKKLGILSFLIILNHFVSYSQVDGDMRTRFNTSGQSITSGNNSFEIYSATTGLWTTMVTASVPNLNPTTIASDKTFTVRDGITQTCNGTVTFASKVVIGEGNAAAGTATITGGAVTGITITTPGKLTVVPGVMFIGAATTIATASVSSVNVTGYEITNPGTGYTSAPTVTIGTPWAASTAVTVNAQRVNGGNLYTCTTAGTTDASGGPTGTGTGIIDGTAIWSYAGVQATATATVGTIVLGATTYTNGITALTITNPGSGYNGMPAITISGDGTGATATPRIGITSINITNGGTGYTTPPTVVLGSTFTVGNGSNVSRNIIINNDLVFKNGATSFTGNGGTGLSCSITLSGSLTAESPISFISVFPGGAPTSQTNISFNGTTPQISGAGSVTLRNLTVGATTVLTINNTTLNIAGTTNINSTGKINATNGSINYITYTQTPVAQTIPNGTFVNDIVKNLTINNTSGVTLANTNTAITGSLVLTAGNLGINTGNTLTLKSGATLTGGSASNFIDTKVDVATGNKGVFAIEGFTSERTFPVGTNGNYLPITITPTVASNFSVTAFNGATVDGTPNGAALSASQKDTSVDAIYFINRTVPASGSPYTLKFGYPTSLKGATFATYTNQIGISNYNGSAWSVPHGSGDNTTNTATDTATTSGAFYITRNSSPTILPVKFSSVNASLLTSTSAKVTWSVGSEVNIDEYVVEASSNGIAFTAVGAVKATGNNTYSLVDNNASGAVVYYRVKSIDKGTGAVNYSAVVSIALNAAKVASVNVYPNPVVGSELHLQTTNFKAGKLYVMLYDNLGKQIAQQAIAYNGGAMAQTLVLSNAIKAGTYQLVVTDGTSSINKTIFVVR